MKIQVNWHNEQQTVLYYSFEVGWDWKDMYDAFAQARDMMESVDHHVNIIMDLSHVSLIPKGALAKIRWAFESPKQKNIGLTVVVTPSSFIKSMIDLGTKLWGRAVKQWSVVFVTTLEEAYMLIEEYDGAING